MMVPQVLATLHLFVSPIRARAAGLFGIYGIVLGLAGAAGICAPAGLLVTLDLARARAGAWCSLSTCRFGLLIIFAALKIMPSVAAAARATRLDVPRRDRAVHSGCCA